MVKVNLNKLPINNAAALLEECLCNGGKGIKALWGWFMGERELIEATIKDLKEGEQS